MKRTPKQKAQWMSKFEELVLTLDDSHRGKIDWNAATYYFNQYMTPEQAAMRYTHTLTDDEMDDNYKYD